MIQREGPTHYHDYLERKNKHLDRIDDSHEPHMTTDNPMDDHSASDLDVWPKRTNITESDVQLVGYADKSGNCSLYRSGLHEHADHAHRTEACRQRVYNELSSRGSEHIIKATAESRTSAKKTTQHRTTHQTTHPDNQDSTYAPEAPPPSQHRWSWKSSKSTALASTSTLFIMKRLPRTSKQRKR